MRLPPAGCTVRRRSAPSPQATSTPSAPTASTVPGGGAAALGSGRGRPHLERLARATAWMAPGTGSNARTARSSTDAGCDQSSARVGAVDLGRVGDAGAGCGAAWSAPVAREPRRARRRCAVAPAAASLAVSVPAVSRGAIGHLDDVDHRPGVEPCVHLHDGDAGARVAGQQRALDRRGAAPARQLRRVDVDAAVARPRQDRGRQDEPVGGHDQHVDAAPASASARPLRLLSVARLEHRNAVRRRQLLHGRRRELAGRGRCGRSGWVRTTGTAKPAPRWRRAPRRRRRECRQSRRAGRRQDGRSGRLAARQPASRCFLRCLAARRARLSGDR